MCTSGSEVKFVTKSVLLKAGYVDAYQLISTESDMNRISSGSTKSLPFGVVLENTDVEAKGQVTKDTNSKAESRKPPEIRGATIYGQLDKYRCGIGVDVSGTSPGGSSYISGGSQQVPAQ
uniref:Uncharacterized protein n=1 Tax=Ditylenchus dipsaci TaxID=166011 RepID=A0A915CPQ0_9BILA